MAVVLTSDIHLSMDTPQRLAGFLAFVDDKVAQAEQFFILGDLFDFWFGDDAVFPILTPLINRLKALSDSGVKLYFMQGNRDFLIGQKFANMTGATLLDDPVVMEIHGHKMLLMHGDLLCTDDHDYMQFRQYVRDPQRQAEYLALPIEKRIEMAKQIQMESKAKTKSKDLEIMDANSDTVIDYMSRYNVERLIHGHTHRPAIHDVLVDNRAGKRIVIGDWRDEPSYVLIDESGVALHDPRVEARI